MTSEDADKIAVQLKRQADAMESIARSLEKIANPPMSLAEIAKANVGLTSVPPATKTTKEA